MSTSIAGQEEMDIKSRVAGGRNVLCLFDVDGTLTPPREVQIICQAIYIVFISTRDNITCNR